jgi:hypothetical protein
MQCCLFFLFVWEACLSVVFISFTYMKGLSFILLEECLTNSCYRFYPYKGTSLRFSLTRALLLFHLLFVSLKFYHSLYLRGGVSLLSFTNRKDLHSFCFLALFLCYPPPQICFERLPIKRWLQSPFSSIPLSSPPKKKKGLPLANGSIYV